MCIVLNLIGKMYCCVMKFFLFFIFFKYLIMMLLIGFIGIRRLSSLFCFDFFKNVCVLSSFFIVVLELFCGVFLGFFLCGNLGVLGILGFIGCLILGGGL